MMIDGKNLPKEVGMYDLVFVQNPSGGWTAWIKDYPAIVHEGETEQETLENINNTLRSLSIL